MKHVLLAAVMCVIAGSGAPRTIAATQKDTAQRWELKSPDGRTSMVLSRQADGRLIYRVLRGRAVVLDDSPLGIRRSDQPFVEDRKSTRLNSSH